MDSRQLLDRFELYKHQPVDDEVRFITAIQLHAFVSDTNRFLALEWGVSKSQFTTETNRVSRLEQARTQIPVNFYCCADDRIGYLIHWLGLRDLRALCG